MENKHDTNIKPDILDMSLQYVNEFGWSRNAIIKGALSLGLPSTIEGLFQKGGYDLIKYFNNKCDENLLIELKTKKLEVNKTLSPKFISENIVFRLEMLVPYLQKLPQALLISSSTPSNIWESALSVGRISDQICYASGLKTTHFDWYTQRAKVVLAYKYGYAYLLKTPPERVTKNENYAIHENRKDMTDDMVTVVMHDAFRKELGVKIEKFLCALDNTTSRIVSGPKSAICSSIGDPCVNGKKSPYGIRTFFQNPYTTLTTITNLLGIRR
ncbi:ubiquinone biosynthesis protein COQ9, mitochondrial-like [Gordionus sp. m RMFG-2023]|uniref:ubiquinone biosynthesis protein COQ9, mitochondrial-like n=1 Tax=Gordionus sp. m RMFG-2023 TaxID=3053472 RepID=UPI0031FCF465